MSTQQSHNPIEGIALELMVTELDAYFGWPELGQSTVLAFMDVS
jgi:uncharacterized protein (DUF2132 family)